MTFAATLPAAVGPAHRDAWSGYRGEGENAATRELAARQPRYTASGPRIMASLRIL
jgi:hypothetical protein